MTSQRLLLGALSLGAIAGIAACGGSTTGPTPTPSSGGLSLPNIPGLGSGTTGSAPAANTLLTASEVQTISGDSNVAALSGTCTAISCIYSDTSADTTGGGGGGVIFVEPFPGAVGQAALQAGISAALSGQANSSGGTAQSVSGLGNGAIKEVDATSVTYAFVKDNYLVVIDVSSGTKSGSDMDSQVAAVAHTVAGAL